MQNSLSHDVLRWRAGRADGGGAVPGLTLATMLILGLTAWLEAEHPFVADVVCPRADCDDPCGEYSDASIRTEFACARLSLAVDRSRPAPAES